MQSIMRLITIVVPVLATAACSTVTPSASQLQAHGSAWVKGMDVSYFALGSTYDVKIKSVDDKSTWDAMTGYSEQMELPAGHHRLIVMCRMVAEVGNVTSQIRDTELDVDLVAGHVYQLQPAGPSMADGCVSKIGEAEAQVAGMKPAP